MALSPTGVSHAKRITSLELATGLYTGTLLIIVMIGSLVAANRIPGLERYALERNAASGGLFVIFMLVPVVRFLRHPVQMFTSGIIGWGIFVVAYDIAGFFFRNLFDVLRTPGEAFVEGAIIYAIFAAGSWVGGMMLHARRHPIFPGRRRPGGEMHPRP
ncbi:MAG TPA: hypothetical protein VMJ93_08120 [Verrucomicrobiae bacterium]|nr:hypothetical protein [Verrucomicrobiae bacterium]